MHTYVGHSILTLFGCLLSATSENKRFICYLYERHDGDEIDRVISIAAASMQYSAQQIVMKCVETGAGNSTTAPRFRGIQSIFDSCQTVICSSRHYVQCAIYSHRSDYYIRVNNISAQMRYLRSTTRIANLRAFLAAF